MPIITLSVIARIIHVSRAAVLITLKDTLDISNEMKRRARELAERLFDMSHDHTGRRHSPQTKRIGMVAPGISISFSSRAIAGVVDIARSVSLQGARECGHP
jgi:DNA-binding LacI/PurR family transcriptional regulator